MLYTALFPAKGALPSLSTDWLTQCILKMNNLQQKQNGNNRNHITETLTIFIEYEKDNTTLSHFKSPPRMALYIFSFLEHSLTFFQRFPTFSRFSNPLAMNGISLHSVSPLWQCVASLSITFSISGNRGISFHNVFGLWQCFITFPALSGNVAPRFRSLAMLHNVSSSLSGNVT